MLSSEDIQRLSILHQEYLIKAVGTLKAKKAFSFDSYQFCQEAFAAAHQLGNDYDYCLPIATDGLFLGFVFEFFGSIPVRIVNMKRRGFGATWHPREPLDLQSKRVIVVDNDVVTWTQNFGHVVEVDTIVR